MIKQVVNILVDLLNISPDDVKVVRLSTLHYIADALIEAGRYTFLVEYKGSAGTGTIAYAAKLLRHSARELGKTVIPLLVVSFMGQTGRRICEEAKVAWLDLSGNARIITPNLRIIISGRPNQFIPRGRPSSPFAPMSSRIIRWLLMHPAQSFTQREIAKATEMDEGFTSRIVTQLENEGFITRNKAGAVRPSDPDLLLDAWHEGYNFSRHDIIYGHIPALSGEDLLHQIAAAMTQTLMTYAATGLAASWLLDHFAGFRIVTIYIPEEPSPEFFKGISFRRVESGANIWLVVPNDEGVFHQASMRDDIWCVHPVQVYLDLKGHPERSKEAAEELRTNHLNWKKNDRYDN